MSEIFYIVKILFNVQFKYRLRRKGNENVIKRLRLLNKFMQIKYNTGKLYICVCVEYYAMC